MAVVPDPLNKSSTKSPSLLLALIIRSIISSGLGVGCNVLTVFPLTFLVSLTDGISQTSGHNLPFSFGNHLLPFFNIPVLRAASILDVDKYGILTSSLLNT